MARRLAFSSIAMALTVVCLFGASTLPTGRVALMAITSVFGALIISEYGVKDGWIHYIGVSILSLLLIPKKMMVLIYILFLGYYPVIKLYIERLNRRWLEWIIKIVVFNVILVTAYTIFKLFLMPYFNSAIVSIVITYLNFVIFALEIIFILYDYILSYIITYYNRNLRERLNHGGINE